MGESERVDVEFRLKEGKKEEIHYYQDVGISWLKTEKVKCDGDESVYVLKESFVVAAADRPRHVLSFEKHNKQIAGNTSVFGFAIACILTLAVLIALTHNPVWVIGWTAKYFVYVWCIGLVMVSLPFLNPDPSPSGLVLAGALAGLFLFVPLAFYQYVLPEMGGIRLLVSFAGGMGVTDPVPGAHEIGQLIISKTSRLKDLPTVMAAWIPLLSALFLAVGKTNLSNAIDKLKSDKG